MTTLTLPLPREAIAQFCGRWKIRELALFGSVLRADFRPESDIDVLVTFSVAPGAPYKDMDKTLWAIRYARAPYPVLWNLWWVPIYGPRIRQKCARLQGRPTCRIRPQRIESFHFASSLLIGQARDAAALYEWIASGENLWSAAGTRE